MSIKEICYAAIPFIMIELLTMAVIIAWPQVVMWLPNLVKG